MGAVMSDRALYFELSAMGLLGVLGAVLLMSGLPGWGLITTAILLASLSFGLRFESAKAKLQPIAIRAEEK